MRGRIEARIEEIVALEIEAQNRHIEATGDAPDGSNQMAMVSAIASSIMAEDIETTVDMLHALQTMLLEDA